MTSIYETSAETAKKIRKTLKKAFPSVRFSVQSSRYSMGSSVDVFWTDGPLVKDVDAILNRFRSGYYDGMQDMYISKGYIWGGNTVYGAKYIDCSRTLSDERCAIIKQYLFEHYEEDQFSGYQLVKAEQAMIEDQKLQGYPSRLIELATDEPKAVNSSF